VGVDAVSGTAGLIFPGDHVDLILTQDIVDTTGGGGSKGAGFKVAAETVLRDVRVIAIDQQLVQGSQGEGAAAGSRTVTLEVTPEEVEKVAVATRLGHLSMAVRPVDAAPSEQNASHPVTYAKDVTNAYAPQKAADAPSPSVIVHEGESDKEYHF